MRSICRIPLAVLLAASLTAGAQTPDYAQLSNAQLINQLSHVNTYAPGLHPSAWVSGFIAVDTQFSFGGGIIGSVAPRIDPAMREFVRRGVAALPTLIVNLNNTTPTQITIANPFGRVQPDQPVGLQVMSGIDFVDYYDPKIPKTPAGSTPPQIDQSARNVNIAKNENPNGSYTFKVGDICFILIGQIVNRDLFAMRYHPTGWTDINSPIVTPDLADRVKADWGDATADDLRDSLISDAREPDTTGGGRWRGALLRLRFYFPSDYQKLKSGDLRDRILEFEKSAAPPPPPAPASSSPNHH